MDKKRWKVKITEVSRFLVRPLMSLPVILGRRSSCVIYVIQFVHRVVSRSPVAFITPPVLGDLTALFIPLRCSSLNFTYCLQPIFQLFHLAPADLASASWISNILLGRVFRVPPIPWWISQKKKIDDALESVRCCILSLALGMQLKRGSSTPWLTWCYNLPNCSLTPFVVFAKLRLVTRAYYVIDVDYPSTTTHM